MADSKMRHDAQVCEGVTMREGRTPGGGGHGGSEVQICDLGTILNTALTYGPVCGPVCIEHEVFVCPAVAFTNSQFSPSAKLDGSRKSDHDCELDRCGHPRHRPECLGRLASSCLVGRLHSAAETVILGQAASAVAVASARAEAAETGSQEFSEASEVGAK